MHWMKSGDTVKTYITVSPTFVVLGYHAINIEVRGMSHLLRK